MTGFHLSPAEVELLNMEKRKQPDLRNVRKLDGILLLHQGLEAAQIAQQLEEPTWRVAAWAECYEEEGLPELLKQEFATAPPSDDRRPDMDLPAIDLHCLYQDYQEQLSHIKNLEDLHLQLRHSLPPGAQGSDLERWLLKAEQVRVQLQKGAEQTGQKLTNYNERVKP